LKRLSFGGQEDKLFSAKYGVTSDKIIPNANFHLIKDAGHLPLMDQPEMFNKILAHFLTQ
jgi:pimeloyl-ACP methyl ester carboxylesterase